MSNSNERGSRLPAVPVPLPGDEPALAEFARQFVDRARSEGVTLTGQGGLLPALVANILQAGLNIELDEHLGYEPYALEGRGSGNSRNGTYPKKVITEVGPVEVRMPRDREGSFEPVTVPKHTRRLEGFSGQVISLYAKGMTTGEIQAHLEEVYSTELSRETISKITDAIVGDMPATCGFAGVSAAVTFIGYSTSTGSDGSACVSAVGSSGDNNGCSFTQAQATWSESTTAMSAVVGRGASATAGAAVSVAAAPLTLWMDLHSIGAAFTPYSIPAPTVTRAMLES